MSESNYAGAPVNGTLLDGGAELQAAHVGHAVRKLTDEHLAEKRRDDPEVTWRAIEERLRMRQEVRGRGLHRPLAGAGSLSAARVAFVAAAAAAVCLAAGGAGWLLFRGTNTDELAFHAPGQGQPGQRQPGQGQPGQGHPGLDASPVTFSVGSQDGKNLVPGPALGASQLLATEHESKFVRFSDSSVIELQPYTTLRVSVLESGTVVARLMQGALEADVHHQERTDYRFQAGSYEVKVVGTAFDLAFEPEPARFDLNLREGRVIVADGEGQTRVVQAGQTLHLPAQPGSTQGTPSTTATSLAELGDSETDGSLVAADSSRADAAHEHGTAPSYRELARRGQFQAIVTAARRTGVERVLAAKGPAELHELAQAARYTGQVALAEKVFSHLASQHARSSEGRSAAFFRGRLAEDSGRLQQAQHHYHAYLAQGGGTYAAEALGRELTLVQKLRGPGAARPLATEYLRRFPRGAYRELAQTLVVGSSAPR